LKEELVDDNDESSPEDEEGFLVHESLEDVLFEEFDDGMFNSSSTCDLSNNSVYGVPVVLLDNNRSPDFPLSDEKDLDLDSNTVISAPSDSASKFKRFALATIVRSPPTTVNLVSASPPQYFPLLTTLVDLVYVRRNGPRGLMRLGLTAHYGTIAIMAQ
jgi:hypothetical protein